MCCEQVDSFSGQTPALTIFPSSSAAKASYDAICGSPGRTIDRFVECEHSGSFLFACGSHDTHAGQRFRCDFKLDDACIVELYEVFIIMLECVNVKSIQCLVHVLQ